MSPNVIKAFCSKIIHDCTYLDQETHMYIIPAMPRIRITQAMMISAYGNTSPLNATAVCVRTDSGGITGA